MGDFQGLSSARGDRGRNRGARERRPGPSAGPAGGTGPRTGHRTALAAGSGPAREGPGEPDSRPAMDADGKSGCPDPGGRWIGATTGVPGDTSDDRRCRDSGRSDGVGAGRTSRLAPGASVDRDPARRGPARQRPERRSSGGRSGRPHPGRRHGRRSAQPRGHHPHPRHGRRSARPCRRHPHAWRVDRPSGRCGGSRRSGARRLGRWSGARRRTPRPGPPGGRATTAGGLAVGVPAATVAPRAGRCRPAAGAPSTAGRRRQHPRLVPVAGTPGERWSAAARQPPGQASRRAAGRRRQRDSRPDAGRPRGRGWHCADRWPGAGHHRSAAGR
ncbi:hypothetical protein GA0070618_1829 [Micromonospora echinospora]|uniref:Uncharacterized protein n=1 Tax=Micromonospora echinospora TaxID=1877 RepID=A0A1C4W3F0_MICEC|nr:hypothetical protein GA0070618_1829 [Micromonospora echinospora]